MRILVCGAGATGMHVARVLSEVHHVSVIEGAPEHLPGGEHAFRVLLGDAADPGVLAQAEAADTDVLIAATGQDQTNLVIARLAKQLGIRWVVARMNDPEHDWLFTPEAGVDIAVSTGALVARLVQEEVTAGDLVTLLRLLLRSLKGVYKAAAVGAVLRLGSSPDPGPGAGVELGGGHLGGVGDLVGIGEVLPGQRLAPEDPPPAFLHVEPAGALGG